MKSELLESQIIWKNLEKICFRTTSKIAHIIISSQIYRKKVMVNNFTNINNRLFPQTIKHIEHNKRPWHMALEI